MSTFSDQVAYKSSLHSNLVIQTEPFHKLRFTVKTENYDNDPDDEGKNANSLTLPFKSRLLMEMLAFSFSKSHADFRLC